MINQQRFARISWTGRQFFFRALFFLFLLPVAVRASEPQASAQPDFSFIQISDTHFEYTPVLPEKLDGQRSYSTMQQLADWLHRQPDATRPAFIINTGDMTEFGFGGQTWPLIGRLMGGIDIPLYWTPGNHDWTWGPDTNAMRKRFGGVNYAFTVQGVRFIALDSPSLQDPAPAFTADTLTFLDHELAALAPADPLVLFMHHPPICDEFASRYDVDRMVDRLTGHNVLFFLVGHYHSAVFQRYRGLDWLLGGSTFSAHGTNAGYTLIELHGGQATATFHCLNDERATTELLHKSLTPAANGPSVTLDAPATGALVTTDSLTVSATLRAAEGTSSTGLRANVFIDEKTSCTLPVAGLRASGPVALAGLDRGAHSLRVVFESGQDSWSRSTEFRFEGAGADQGRAVWRRNLASGVKATPLWHDGRLYVGTLGGELLALDAQTGQTVWQYLAGAEILTRPVIWDNRRLAFATGAGRLVVLDLDGREEATLETGHAIYSSPVLDDEGVLYCGTNGGEVLAYDLAQLRLRWRRPVAPQSIESTPGLASDRLIVGAWDGYLYGLSRQTGETLWRALGPRNQGGVNRYYSPAEDGPKILGDKIFVTDRSFHLGCYDLDGRFLKELDDKTTAVGLAPGDGLLLRRAGRPLARITPEGTTQWEAPVVAGRIPVAPLEADGSVYCVTNNGLLTVMDAATGAPRWRYQVTPQLFVTAGVAVHAGQVYAAGLDGTLTAIAPPAAR